MATRRRAFIYQNFQVADYADHRGFLKDETGWTDNHAFLYQAGRLTDLGILPGGTQSYAYAINNLGQAVGASEIGRASCRERV